MKVLALELSSGRGSIAFADNFVLEFANDRKHSGLFFENLRRGLEQCGHPECIVVGLGPGSYAGTRIAIATAIGLQAATDAELIGLPSVCALPNDSHEYVVVGDARLQSFWFARVCDRAFIEGPTLCSAAELTTRLSETSTPVFSTEILSAFPHVPVLHPSASVLAKMAQTSPDAMKPPLEPLYLRDPHITQPKAAAWR